MGGANTTVDVVNTLAEVTSTIAAGGMTTYKFNTGNSLTVDAKANANVHFGVTATLTSYNNF
jgi:hypothetical protein